MSEREEGERQSERETEREKERERKRVREHEREYEKRRKRVELSLRFPLKIIKTFNTLRTHICACKGLTNLGKHWGNLNQPQCSTESNMICVRFG